MGESTGSEGVTPNSPSAFDGIEHALCKASTEFASLATRVNKTVDNLVGVTDKVHKDEPAKVGPAGPTPNLTTVEILLHYLGVIEKQHNRIESAINRLETKLPVTKRLI